MVTGAGAELATLIERHPVVGANLMRDAANLRHRHPAWWAAVMGGRVEAWKAVRLLHLPGLADLTADQARGVDAVTVEVLVGFSYDRAEEAVRAAIIAADPAAAEERRRVEAERRYVSLGRSTDHGLRHLIARLTAPDAARLDALLDAILDTLADLLQDPDTTDQQQETPEATHQPEQEARSDKRSDKRADKQADKNARRSAALGLLANPAAACLALATRADNPAAAALARVREEFPEATLVDLAAAMGRALRDLTGLTGPQLAQRVAPKTTLYLHLAAEAVAGVPGTEVARGEGPHGQSLGPATLTQVREWLTGSRVTLRPVIDLNAQMSAASYEIPRRLREQVILTHPVEVFPYGTCPSRATDHDHTIPYQPDQPHQPYQPESRGGPTATGNLGPLGRHQHNLKTHAPGWEHHQPLPGLFLWKTPTGRWYQVDHHGTRPLGTHTPPIIEQQRNPRPTRSHVLTA